MKAYCTEQEQTIDITKQFAQSNPKILCILLRPCQSTSCQVGGLLQLRE